jgi:tRNA-uridine 2-sulfurtransferase
MTSPISPGAPGPSYVPSDVVNAVDLTKDGIVVAMSGGVDSSVAAWLLREAGHPLIGLFMRNGVHVGEHESAKKSCCSVSDARDARMVAAGLGIPFQSVDLKDEFGSIIRYFLAEYSAGRTPNPCAVCNRDLKFGRLLRFARELGAAGVATGHYARIDRVDGRVRVRRGVDRSKDQSYQLFCVAEADLAFAHLPIGGLAKRDVRALASKVGLRTAEKADSQEICFVPSNDYRKLLAERGVVLHPGKLVDTSGRVLGDHAGTEHFTIGQRRGHGVAGATPLYVVAVLPETGTVVLGTREECHARSMRVRELNWIGFDAPASNEFTCEVQVRYHHDPARCTVQVEGSEATVEFDEPQLAIAAGQGAAFYSDERLLGGGWIASSAMTVAAATGGFGNHA